MFQNFDDMQRLAKVNMDAVTKSLDVMAKNVQTIATEMTDYSKRSFENGSKTLEKLLGAKSLDKAIEVQSEYAQATYEDYVAQATYEDYVAQATYEDYVAQAAFGDRGDIYEIKDQIRASDQR